MYILPGEAQDGWGTSPRQLVIAFPEGIPAAGAAGRVSGSDKATGKGHGARLASSADQP